MSSYIADLTIGSNTYKVLDADISYYQHTRGGGMPSSEIQGGTFSVKIESSDGPQYDMFTEWMFGKSSMKEGYIRFYKKDGMGRLFDFEFYDAHCIRYHEHFNYTENQPMITLLTISPGITRIQNLVKEKPWKVSDPTQKVIETHEQEAKPLIIEGYFIDINGGRINKLYEGDTVYFVLNTQNMIGMKVDIDFNDNNNDFKYNGEVLKNDKLEGFSITNDYHEIKLEVILQK